MNSITAVSAVLMSGTLALAQAPSTWYYNGMTSADAYGDFLVIDEEPFASYLDHVDFGPITLNANAYAPDTVWGGFGEGSALLGITVRRGYVKFDGSSSTTGFRGASAGSSIDLTFRSSLWHIATIGGVVDGSGLLTITGSDGFSIGFTGTFSDSFWTSPGVTYHLEASHRASNGGPTSSSLKFEFVVPTPGGAALAGVGAMLAVRRRRG